MKGRGCFQGFHFEVKMDACAHFLLSRRWLIAPYIIQMSTLERRGGTDADEAIGLPDARMCR